MRCNKATVKLVALESFWHAKLRIPRLCSSYACVSRNVENPAKVIYVMSNLRPCIHAAVRDRGVGRYLTSYIPCMCIASIQYVSPTLCESCELEDRYHSTIFGYMHAHVEGFVCVWRWFSQVHCLRACHRLRAIEAPCGT
jgi:hypothetical protein